MSYISLIAPALGLLLVPIAHWLQRLQARKVRDRLRERCRDLIAGAEVIDVGWWTSEAFANSSSGRPATPGLLVIVPDEIRLVGVERVSDRLRVDRFPIATSKVALFGTEPLLGPGTAVVRLTDGAGGIALLWRQERRQRGGGKVTRELFDRLRRRVARDPASEDGQGHSYLPALTRVAFLLILLAAAALTLVRIGAIAAPPGPQQVRSAPDGSVFAFTATELVRLERDGSNERRWSLTGLGVTDGLTALQGLDHDTVLLGDYAGGRILRCDLRRPSCSPIPQAGERYQRAFKFLLAADGRTLWVSDTARDRVLRTDVAGTSVRELAAPGGWCFPNAIVESGDGVVSVADTNFYRVLDWTADGTFRAARPVVASEPVATRCSSMVSGNSVPAAWIDRAKRYATSERAVALPGLDAAAVWVTDLARGRDGRWWLVLNADDLRHGQLVRFEADFSHPLAITLPHGDPWSVATTDDGVLLADPSVDRLLRFDTNGRVLPGGVDPAHVERHDRPSPFEWDDPWLRWVLPGIIGLLALQLSVLLLRSRNCLKRILAT